MSEVAKQLQASGYRVLEKELMPKAGGEEDRQLDPAIWVVLAFPLVGKDKAGANPDYTVLRERLKQGGRTLLMFTPQSNELAPALEPWGIEVQHRAVAVHEVKPAAKDPAENLAESTPFVFDLKDYGKHAITTPLSNKRGLIVPLIPVKTRTIDGVTLTPLLPIPQTPRSWGETDLNTMEDKGIATFDPDQGDIAGPLHAGVAAERRNGARLVIIGSPMFAFDRWVNDVDQARLKKTGIFESRYPANAELFLNCVQWLAGE
jgi:hypothetical protein